ncbi:MAG: tetratricopeptide repeat protein [Bacteroidota bacterium]
MKSTGSEKDNKVVDSIGPILSIALICLTGFLIYSNTLSSSFHFDDRTSIIENRVIHDIGNFRLLWKKTPTRVFSYWTFALNYYWNDLDVLGYHLVNIAIHILSGISLWWLIQLLFKTPVLRETPASRYKKILSLAGALIFIVHPIQTQAVTYIVQRIASLAALMYLVSMCCYIRARLENHSRNKQFMFFLLSFFSAILAIFSKETAYTLPCTIVLYELFFMREKSRIWKFIIILCGGATIAVLLLLYFMGKFPPVDAPDISRIEYLWTQFTVIPMYMRLLVLPVHQNLDYDVAIIRSLTNPWALSGLALIIAVLAAGALLYRRHRLLSFGIFWFFLTLVVESSIIPIRDVIFEHRLYLPMAGFCFITIALVEGASRYVSHYILRYSVGFIILIFAVIAYARNEVWKDEITLWNDCVMKSPNKSRVYLNRGLAYHKQEMFNEALRDYESALRLKPDNWAALSNTAAILDTRGDYDNAIALYTRAIEAGKGAGVEVYFSRSTSYTKKGLYAEALRDLDLFITWRTDLAEAYYNRGCLRRTLKNSNGAMTDFTRAIALDSSQGDYFFDRGILYQEAGQLDNAISDYDKAIQRKSHGFDCYINKGYILMQQHAFKEAIQQYTLALEYDPNSVHVLNDRGLTFYDDGDYSRALEDFNKAIRLDSLNPRLYKNRSIIYKALGQKGEADQDLRKAGLLLMSKPK